MEKEYQEKNVYFDNDYTQKKSNQVRGVIKKLQEKNIKSQCLYPANLTISGVRFKDFPHNVWGTANTEGACNQQITDYAEASERDLQWVVWTTWKGGKKSQAQLLIQVYIRAIIGNSGGDEESVIFINGSEALTWMMVRWPVHLLI